MRAVAPPSPDLGELLAWLVGLDAAGDELTMDIGDARPGPALGVGIASLVASRRARGQSTKLSGARAAELDALSPIVDLRAARSQADAQAERLEQQAPDAAQSVVRAVRFVFEELGANVVQQSGAADTGFGSVAPTADGFELALADRGMGFRASLQRHPELSGRIQDDAEAIQVWVAREFGVLCELSDRLGGDLWIASGDALWHRRTAQHGLRVATVRGAPAYRGAFVCLRAPLAPSASAGLPSSSRAART
ncbi:MAG: hypothetical protein HZB39_10075 [Planctomycetes bacterium]|nr:hypothetical protein [Planctomycetota bacterium]